MEGTNSRGGRPMTAATHTSMASSRSGQRLPSANKQHGNRLASAKPGNQALISSQSNIYQTQNQQSLQLNTKYLLGVNPDVNPSVLVVDDSQIVYICGHNIVLYNTDDKSQKFIPGLEGTQSITAMAISSNRRQLAVCEKSTQAVCLIYDLQTLKRRRILTSQDYNSQEFISVNFANSTDKTINYLATLTAAPDYRIIIWVWDKQRCLTSLKIDIDHANSYPLHCSFMPDDPNCVLVTGKHLYRYYKMQENYQMKAVHNVLTKKDSTISTNYTCHAWVDKRLIVCTAKGDILIAEQGGDFKINLPESPGQSFPIMNICAIKEGFFISSNDGRIWVYDISNDPKCPYTNTNQLPKELDYEEKYSDILQQQDQMNQLQFLPKVMSLDIQNDKIIYVTKNRQLMKMKFSIEKPDDIGKFSVLICPFHEEPIHGLDTCLKKHIIATCSADKSVRIWSFNPLQQRLELEICQKFPDEALSLTIHPSGLHILVSFNQDIRFYNILADRLEDFHQVPIKSCKEIRFSHGGHLFACHDGQDILVFRFYTATCPKQYVFSQHQSLVRGLVWSEDDTSFFSCGKDYKVLFWKICQTETELAGRKPNDPVAEYQATKSCEFLSIQTYKIEKGEKEVSNQDQKKSRFMAYVCGTDGSIREIEGNQMKTKYESSTSFSQLAMMYGRRAFFAGVNDSKDIKKPGSIQVLSYPSFDKIQEMQVHSKGVLRLALNHENNCLFSTGKDASLAFFGISDREPRKKDLHVAQSAELLIPRKERESIIQNINSLKSEIDQHLDQKRRVLEATVEEKKQQVELLQDQIERCQHINEAEEKSLQIQLRDLRTQQKEELNEREIVHKKQIETMAEDHLRKVQYDEEKYQALLKDKEDKATEYQDRMGEVRKKHVWNVKRVDQNNLREKAMLDKYIAELTERISAMATDTSDIRTQVENEAWRQIDLLNDKNKVELSKEIEKGLASKTELTNIAQLYKERKSRKDVHDGELKQRQANFDKKIKDTQALRKAKDSKIIELRDRDQTLEEKRLRILDLRKKILELEKFKFVLDYKIKELRRDINPRELEIKDLVEQTNKMRSELKHFDRVNKNLMLIVEDLRMRQEGLTTDVGKLRQTLERQEKEKRRFQEDLLECLHQLGDFKKLKKGVIKLHKIWVLEEVKIDTGDSDMHRNYAINRRQLENNVSVLKQMLEKDTKAHRAENKRIMSENVDLIKQINEIKQEAHKLQRQKKQLEAGFELSDDIDPRNGQSQFSSNGKKRPMSHIRAKSARPTLISKQLRTVKIEVGAQEEEIKELEKVYKLIEEENEQLRIQQDQERQAQAVAAQQQMKEGQSNNKEHDSPENRIIRTDMRMDQSMLPHVNTNLVNNQVEMDDDGQPITGHKTQSDITPFHPAVTKSNYSPDKDGKQEQDIADANDADKKSPGAADQLNQQREGDGDQQEQSAFQPPQASDKQASAEGNDDADVDEDNQHIEDDEAVEM